MQKLFLFPPVLSTVFLRNGVTFSFAFGGDDFWKSQYAILPPSFHLDLSCVKEIVAIRLVRCSAVM